MSSTQSARFLPWISRLFLLPPALVMSMISYRHLATTARAVSGTTLATPEAFTDMRVIGGWMLTLLALLLYFFFSRDRLWLAHLQVVLFAGLTLIVRIYGFAHDGTTLAMGNQRAITIVETIFLILNAIGLAWQLRSAPAESPLPQRG